MTQTQLTRLDGFVWLICLSRLPFYGLFMAYSACMPLVMRDWDMSATQAGTIAFGFMIGYGLSLFGFSWYSDRWGARHLYMASAVASTVVALAFAFLARSYLSTLITYTLVALTLGGTYTPAVMLLADRYAPRCRGSAVGYLIASTSLGYALSLALAGGLVVLGGYRLVFLVTGLLPLAGLVLSWVALRDTPRRVHPRSGGGNFLALMRKNGGARNLVLGYTGHSFELLGMWAWIPAFLAAGYAAGGSGLTRAAEAGAYVAAALHLTGMVASFSMGRLSDRLGRRTVLVTLGWLGAAASLGIGWLIGAPAWVIALVALAYGFVSVGDSPVLTTAITEHVEPGVLGTVLAFRSLAGFGAGAIAPVAFGFVLDHTNLPGQPPTVWGWAFVCLGLGGVVAGGCAMLLTRERDGHA